MHELPWQAVHQFGAFTTEQAVAAGWSPSALTRAVKSGRLHRIRQGAYTAGVPSQDARLLLAVAAALTNPQAVVSHAAAALAHELPLFDVPPDRACLTLPARVSHLIPGVHVHRTDLPAGTLSRHHDLAITGTARTCLDLTREFGLASGLVAADAALHQRLTTTAELNKQFRGLTGRASSPATAKMLALADGRRESPLESVSAIGLATLPVVPEPQVRFWTLDGVFLGRTDFWWEEFGVIGEADGRSKYSDDALWEEKQREEAFTRNGIVVVRWGMREAVRTQPMLDRVQEGWRRAMLLRSAGVVPAVRAKSVGVSFG